jgi:hypothetical protein
MLLLASCVTHCAAIIAECSAMLLRCTPTLVQVLLTASSLANRTPADVARLLELNPSATLTDSGAIVFGCSLHPEDEQHQHSDGHGQNAAQPPQQQEQQEHESHAVLQLAPPASGQGVWEEKDTSKAFKLHSRPSASKKIFLEFNGCVTEVGGAK